MAVTYRLHEPTGDPGAMIAKDCAQNASAVTHCPQVGISGAPRQLEAWNLRDPQPHLHRVHDHLGLDLESRRRKIQVLEIATVERAESVAQVGKPSIIE